MKCPIEADESEPNDECDRSEASEKNEQENGAEQCVDEDFAATHEAIKRQPLVAEDTTTLGVGRS